MSQNTPYDKIIQTHTLQPMGEGRVQLFIDMDYMHEVTSSPAFENLKDAKIYSARFPQLNIATLDHVVATLQDDVARNFEKGNRLERALRKNAQMYGIELIGQESGKQGIVHTIGPELGITQPGMVIVCGDSHTSTHGAFGNLSYGIGTTQVERVLRAQSLSHKIAKVRRIEVTGKMPYGVEAKDIALNQIRLLGVAGGIGYVHEWGGPALDNLSMEERMTISNLGTEGQAVATLFNPDMKTIEYLRGRERVPKGEQFERATKYWLSFAAGKDAVYDHVFEMDASKISPIVTWGNNPGQSVFIDERIPQIESFKSEGERKSAAKALSYMKFNEGEFMRGKKIDMVFIGSCTNGRISDLERAAKVMQGYHVAEGVKALVVPGSQQVKKAAEELGLDKIFLAAGAEWRDAGCSMCLGMNTDRVDRPILIASTSNRNFQDRMGEGARTVLMSPSMAAYSAIKGEVSDVREHTYQNAW